MEYNEDFPPELDAVIAAPDSHVVLLENEQVRVLRVLVSPGHREPPHTHQYPSVFIFINASPLRYYGRDGSFEFETDGKASANKTEWLPPEGIHAVENIGTVIFEALRIELKTSL